MNTPTKLGLYGLSLTVAFAGAVGVGRLAGPEPRQPAAHEISPDHADASSGSPERATDGASLPGGLQVSEAGYRLAPVTPSLPVGTATDFSFRIIGPDQQPVTSFTATHERDLHLIIVRRDLSGFQHLHPNLGPNGVWSQPLTVTEAGQYRFFADFRPAGRAEALTLGVDVPAPGAYEPHLLPPSATTARVDGYDIALTGALVPGTSSRLTLRVTRNGAPVTDLQPYLGAYGHLVALRDGDLAYLHVHPDGEPGDGRTPAGPEIVFHAEVPSTGVYRLFLDFRHDGVVRTAEFTAVAGEAQTAPPTAPSPTGDADQPHGHG